jgi:hypothetical protein
MEDVNGVLRSVKAKSTTAAETAHTGIRSTGEFLGYIAAAVEALDGFSTALPSEETLNAVVGHITTAQDETLDAYSILQGYAKQTSNVNLTEAADQARYGLESLAAPDTTRFQAAPSAPADAARLQAGISELHAHIAELRALATETGAMYQAMGGTVQEAITEGDSAITEITTYQQEKGMGA